MLGMENRSKRKHTAKLCPAGFPGQPGEEPQPLPAVNGLKGVLWRQPPAAPTPATSSCCQNVWG